MRKRLIKSGVLVAAFLAGSALAQVRSVPVQGPSATCYRHEPVTRVLCRVELPPGGTITLRRTETYYRDSDMVVFDRNALAVAFYVTFPLSKEARSFENLTVQQRTSPKEVWVEFSVPSGRNLLPTLRLGPLEVKNVSLNLVLPVGYQAPPGDSGDYDYKDETGFQLIDGETGIAPYTASKGGNPPSYEWVAWQGKKVTLLFTLPSWTAQTPVKRVLIRTFRGSGGIEMPRRITVFDNRSSGAAFEVDPGAFKPEEPTFLELEGEFYGPTVIVELEPAPGAWIFVDEVRFSLR